MKAGFLETNVLLDLPILGDIRITKSELNYYSDLYKTKLTVPVGLETDFGTIPKILQLVFPKDGIAVFAYILHDYLYKTGLYTRKECDQILAEAMGTLGVKNWKIKSIKFGVRIGGLTAWNNYREGK